MKKILPFETSPYLDLYQYYAFSFGILQGNSNTYPWIYSNFIQYDINGEDIWLEYRKAFSRTHIHEGNQDYPREGILDSIKNCILNDYYVLGYCDEFYIPQKMVYGKTHFLHDFLIYGFDDDTKTLYSFGYVIGKNSKYQVCKPFTISYNDMLQSIIKAHYHDCWTEYFYKITINPNLDLSFNRMRFCDELYQYIKQPVLWVNEPINGPSGICNWKYLFDLISSENINSIPTTVTFIKKSNQYVKMMFDRLKYVNEHEISIPDLVENYSIVYEKSNRVVTMAMMYRITLKKELLEDIKNILKEIFYDEHIILEKLFDRFVIQHSELIWNRENLMS